MSDGPAPSTAVFDPDQFRTRLDHLALSLVGRGGGRAGRVAAVGRLARRLSGRLARPFRLAVIGETNVGKTSLVNRLLGQDLLATDVITNTRIATVAHHASPAHVAIVGADGVRQRISELPIERASLVDAQRLELGLPVAGLRVLELIDTPPLDPATDARSMAERAGMMPDIVVWCTLSTQAWRASEVHIWQRLAVPSERALLVATQADGLAAGDRAHVLARLEREAGADFSAVVMVGEGEADSGLDQLRAAVDAVRRRLDADRCRRAATTLRRQLESIVPVEADRV